MAQATTNEIKPGFKVEVDNEPYYVVSNEFVKPGKGQAINRIRLKSILSGRVLEKTYKSGEKLDLADVEEKQFRLLYLESHDAVFMDDATYEQINVSFTSIKERGWLKDDCLYSLILYKGDVVDVSPPTVMELVIKETAPGVRRDTASGRVMKSAVLETGMEIQIPIFIGEGEKIKVDTRTGEYVSRSNT
jgi:elongation factor P